MVYSNERLQKLVEEFREHADAILAIKDQQYTPSGDRLQNFRQVAAFEGRRPTEVVLTYLLKHMQAIQQAVAQGRYDWVWTRPDGTEGLKQRFTDLHNYLYLLAAAIDEEVDSGKRL